MEGSASGCPGRFSGIQSGWFRFTKSEGPFTGPSLFTPLHHPSFMPRFAETFRSAIPQKMPCPPVMSFSGMTPLRVPAKQDHYHPSRQRPRKGQQGGSGDRQVSQSGKPLLRRSLRSLNLPAGRYPLGSPGRVFHPCIRNTQKCSTSGERSTGPSVMCFAISVRGLPALCTPRQRLCPCIPPKGLHPFGIPQLPARQILPHNAIWTGRAMQSRKQFYVHPQKHRKG